jgi:hypothetical protein
MSYGTMTTNPYENLGLVVDLPSAAYALAERVVRLRPSGIHITSGAGSCSVSFTLSTSESFRKQDAICLDEAIQFIRRKCSDMTITIQASSGAGKQTWSIPPRSKRIIQLLSDVTFLCIALTGWTASLLPSCSRYAAREWLPECLIQRPQLPSMTHWLCRSPDSVCNLALVSALGRLALASSVPMSCSCTDVKRSTCTLQSSVPQPGRFLQVSSTSRDKAVIVVGHVAPIDVSPSIRQGVTPTVLIQEVSLNGMPVIDTLIHKSVVDLHQRVLKPYKHLCKSCPPEAAFVLHIGLPQQDATFTGSMLKRSAMVVMENGVNEVLATVLLQAWGTVMPASVLHELGAMHGLGAGDEAKRSTMPAPANQQEGASADQAEQQAAAHTAAPTAVSAPVAHGSQLGALAQWLGA